jgi:hypothetical protein
MTHRLDITIHDIGQRGPRYSVSYEGKQIVEATTTPLLDGCRALLALNLSGLVEMWSDDKPHPRMRTTVEAGSLLTVAEGHRTSPRFTRFKEWGESRRGRAEDVDADE